MMAPVLVVQLFVETLDSRAYMGLNTAGPHTLRCARAGFRLGLPA
jgi:hypothetical protein